VRPNSDPKVIQNGPRSRRPRARGTSVPCSGACRHGWAAGRRTRLRCANPARGGRRRPAPPRPRTEKLLGARLLEKGQTHQDTHVEGVADGLEIPDSEDDADLGRGRARRRIERVVVPHAEERLPPLVVLPGEDPVAGHEPERVQGTCRPGRRRSAAAARARGGWRPRPRGPTRPRWTPARRCGSGCDRRPRPTAPARCSPPGQAGIRRGRGGTSGRLAPACPGA
jgi:hypothetical protein